MMGYADRRKPFMQLTAPLKKYQQAAVIMFVKTPLTTGVVKTETSNGCCLQQTAVAVINLRALMQSPGP
jgi:hypothetical protein